MQSKWARAAILVAALSVLAACSSATPSAKPSGGGSIKIAFPIPGPAPYIDGYFTNWDKLAADAGVETIKTTGDWTPQLQAEQIDSLIAQKPDVMVIWAVDNKAIVPVLARVKAAGIPMVVSNAFPEQDAFQYVAGYTGPNDVLQGEIAAQSLANVVQSGDIAMIRGTPGTAAHDQRAEGFTEKLASIAPDLKLVADESGAWGDKKLTYDIATAILKREPGIVAIFTQDDTAGAGAAQAAADLGLSVKVIGIGGSCDAFKLIKTGEITATTVQDPWEDARLAFEAAVAVASGKSIEKITYLDPPVVTVDNVATFECHW